MTSSGGSIKERIAYTPYGEASQRLHEDINNAGIVDGGDIGFITNSWGATIGSPGYNPDADLNDDGTINGSDISPITNNYNASGALPGQLFAFGNTVGYSGYLYDDAINLSLARFRWHDADTGRWTTRDPLEYDDGSSQYQYVDGRPLQFVDPLGLASGPYGLPRDFWAWYHRQIKKPGDPDLAIDNARVYYEYWKEIGEPDAEGTRIDKNGKKRRGSGRGGIFGAMGVAIGVILANPSSAGAPMIIDYINTIDPRYMLNEWTRRRNILDDVDGDNIPDEYDPDPTKPDVYDRVLADACTIQLKHCINDNVLKHTPAGHAYCDINERDRCLSEYKKCLTSKPPIR